MHWASAEFGPCKRAGIAGLPSSPTARAAAPWLAASGCVPAPAVRAAGESETETETASQQPRAVSCVPAASWLRAALCSLLGGPGHSQRGFRCPSRLDMPVGTALSCSPELLWLSANTPVQLWGALAHAFSSAPLQLISSLCVPGLLCVRAALSRGMQAGAQRRPGALRPRRSMQGTAGWRFGLPGLLSPFLRSGQGKQKQRRSREAERQRERVCVAK